MQCYMCKNRITKKNSSVEHIIPNAICGKLKSNRLLCKDCNSKMGLDIDSELANQLNFVANLLDLKRDRGKPQDIRAMNKTTGDKYRILPGGKPMRLNPLKEVVKVYDDDGKITDIQIKVKTNNLRQAKSVINSLQKEYNFDDLKKERILQQYEISEEYINEPIEWSMELGGKRALRAVAKIAINYYFHNKKNRKYVEGFLEEVFYNDEVLLNNVSFFYPDNCKEVIEKINDDEILHSIIIKGDLENNLLYSIIELFNGYRVLVIMNREYYGEDIEEFYIYDVITRRERGRKVNIRFSRKEILYYIDNTNKDIEARRGLMLELNSLMGLIQRKQHGNKINQITTNAFNDMANLYPEEKYYYINEEMINFLSSKIARDFTMYINQNKL